MMSFLINLAFFFVLINAIIVVIVGSLGIIKTEFEWFFPDFVEKIKKEADREDE